MVKQDAHVKKYKNRVYHARYREANKAAILEREARYREENRATIAEGQACHREANKAAILERKARYREANIEAIAKYAAQYHVANKELRNKNQRKYRRDNPAYTVARDALKRVRNGAKTGLKTSQVFDLVGYTSEDLRAHMESLFIEGMSWENHGEWHIDHIKPVATFKAEGVTDIKVINALSNLQPLWAKDNLSKGAKF